MKQNAEFELIKPVDAQATNPEMYLTAIYWGVTTITTVGAKKWSPFSQLVLCSFRACLGEMIVFVHMSGSRRAFFAGYGDIAANTNKEKVRF